MTWRNVAASIGLVGLALALAGCEPATLTEARGQLGRAGTRTVSLAIPISRDTFFVSRFLRSSDTATTPGGLLGTKLPAESLTSAVGQQLAFNNLTFQTFQFSYDSLLIAAPDSGTVTARFAPPAAGAAPGLQLAPPTFQLDTLRFATPHGTRVAVASAASGTLDARVVNHTSCAATVTQTVTDSGGATVLAFPATPVAAGDSVTVSRSAAGLSFRGYLALAAPTVTPSGTCVPAAGQTVAVHLITTSLALASVTLRNVAESFSRTYGPLAGEPRLTAVDTVVANSGSIVFTVRNRLPLTASLTVALNGVTRGGTTVSTPVTVAAAAGDGTYRTTTVTVNLAGATIRPAAVVAAVSGTVTAATATITAALAANAEVVDGVSNLIVQSAAGRLDPTLTPELSVAVEEYREILSSRVDFGDLQDAMKSARINDATGALAIRNTAQAPLALAGVTLGVVRLSGTGALQRDAQGHPAYERDSTTNLPILVALAPSGQSRLDVPRAGSATLSVPMAPLVDRLVHLLLTNVRTAVVAAGTIVAGDGSPSRITRNDSAAVKLLLTVGMDISLPDSGIVFTRTEMTGGAGLGAADSATIAGRLSSAVVASDVVNGTPFAMTVDLAVVGGSLPSGSDVFAQPGHVDLGPFAVAGSAVDASGLVASAASSSQSVSLTADQVRPLLGRNFTTGVRIRLRPPPGGGGRGAIRPSDMLVVRAHATVEGRAGGGQ